MYRYVHLIDKLHKTEYYILLHQISPLHSKSQSLSKQVIVGKLYENYSNNIYSDIIGVFHVIMFWRAS